MSKPDENEKRNTPNDWQMETLGKFDFVTGCIWLVVIAFIAIVVAGIVMVARRFL